MKKFYSKKKFSFFTGVRRLLFFAVFSGYTSSAWAMDLGTAVDYAVLGASDVTNTGPTTLNGNLGIWPGTAISGFSDITLSGALHLTDFAAQQAQSDLAEAYLVIAGLPFDFDLSGQDLGAVGTLFPGVYHFSSSAQLTGTLLLDAQGEAEARFIFQIESALTAANGSRVQLLNVSKGSKVFWQVGSSATLGAGSFFQGSILARSSITFNGDARIECGQALAQNGAVILESNAINVCDEDGDVVRERGIQAIPETDSFFLVGLGFGMGILTLFKKFS